MAHIGGGGLVALAALELDHIVVVDVGIAAVVLLDTHVAVLTGGVREPFGIRSGAQSVAVAHGGGVHGGAEQLVLVLIGQSLHVAAGGHLLLQLLGQSLGLSLGGVKGGLLLLVGHLHGVALLVGLGGHVGLNGQHGVVVGVQLIRVLLIVGLQLLVRVGQAALAVVLVVGSDGLVGDHFGAGSHVHIGTVVSAHIGLHSVAAGAGLGFQLRQLLVHIGLAQRREGVALFLCLVADHGVFGQSINGRLQEVVVPGGAGLLVLDLLLGVHGAVKAFHKAIPGSYGGLLIEGVIIELYVSDGIVLAVHGEGYGPLLEKAAVPHQQGHGQGGDDDAQDDVDHPLALAALLGAVVALLSISRALAGLFFSGCTHSLFRPLVIELRTPEPWKTGSAFHDIIQNFFPGFKGAGEGKGQLLHFVHGKRDKKDRGLRRGPVPSDLCIPRSGRVNPFKTCT